MTLWGLGSKYCLLWPAYVYWQMHQCHFISKEFAHAKFVAGEELGMTYENLQFKKCRGII